MKGNASMKALDLLRAALEFSDQATLQLIEDMRDAPLTRPTANGGNHPLWVLGHLANAEGVLQQVLLGGSNPLEKWMPLFGPGSEPMNDCGAYPSFDDVMQAYRDLRSRNLALLDSMGESGLDAPTKAPFPGLEQLFGTVGMSFLTTALHQMNHRGQVADARRAAGRKPIFELPATATN
jgi:hypothetical protein